MATHPEDKYDMEKTTQDPSQNGEVLASNTIEHDAVFGEITEDGPNYRNVGWIGTTALMMKTQIGLGVLSMLSSVGLQHAP